MEIIIREMKECDRECVVEMMRVFYASDAVLTNGSDEIFSADINACLSDSPYLEGYIIKSGDAVLGYGMIAKSYSTEYGVPCIWIEDIYIKDSHRGLGIGSAFLKFIEKKYEGHILRLEAEAENGRAVSVYRKCGFEVIPYLEMKKLK